MRKISQREQTDKGKQAELYCFPTIAAGGSSNENREAQQNHFRPIDFREGIDSPEGCVSIDPEAKLHVPCVKHEEAREKVDFVEKAKEKAKEIEHEAFLQGFRKGEKAGLKSGMKEFEAVLRDFRQALVQLFKVKEKIHVNMEKESVELALAIARKIVCHEVATNKEVVLSVVREALKKVMGHEKIKIKVNPADFQFIESTKFKLSSLVEDIENAEIEEDEKITSGGCVIETDFGDIDARIDRQLKAVEEAFETELKKSSFRDRGFEG